MTRPITQRASAPRIFSLTLINQPPMITRPYCAAPASSHHNCPHTPRSVMPPGSALRPATPRREHNTHLP